MSSLVRTRWAAVGAAVAVTLGAGGIGLVAATSPAGAATFVPIEPCRLADTRPAPDNVGPRATPIGEADTLTITAHGDNGQCTGIPTTATGLVLNVTAIGATNPTFLTIWGDGDQPDASHLNPVPSQPPTPNAVTTDLTDTDGAFHVYNRFGSVDVITDIVGYYTDHHHDDRYYTETETDTALAAKADTAALADKQDACAPGTVLAYAQVQGLGLPTTLTDVGGFNCTGGTILASQEDPGEYRIRFENLPVAGTTEGLVVQVTSLGVSGGTIVGYGSFNNGDLRVELFDHQGTAVDKVFSVSLLDPGSES